MLSPQLIGAGGLAGLNMSPTLATSLGGLTAGRLPTVFPMTGGFLPAGTPTGGILYWPYPSVSPPISPTAFYAQSAAIAQQTQHAAQQGPCIVLMRGLPGNATIPDVLNFFQGFPEARANFSVFISIFSISDLSLDGG